MKRLVALLISSLLLTSCAPRKCGRYLWYANVEATDIKKRIWGAAGLETHVYFAYYCLPGYRGDSPMLDCIEADAWQGYVDITEGCTP